MSEQMERLIETLENIQLEIESLVVLKEHQLGVRLKRGDAGAPYVPREVEE